MIRAVVGKFVVLVACALSVVAMLQPDRVTSGIVAGLVFTSFLLTISPTGTTGGMVGMRPTVITVSRVTPTTTWTTISDLCRY